GPRAAMLLDLPWSRRLEAPWPAAQQPTPAAGHRLPLPGGLCYGRAMIKIGDALPDATLYESVEFGEACPLAPQKLSAAELARGKKIVAFGLPGALTPSCSAKHARRYVQHLDELKRKGVDEVWCISVNDGFVMAAWGKQLGAFGKIRMFGD